MTSAVLDEAIKKAALAWIAVSGDSARALWCLPLAGSLIVVSGPGEQHAPGLAEATRATVQLRGSTGGLIVVSDMAVTRIAPDTDEWAEVAPQLAQKRLNASGSAEQLAARWAATGCLVVRLTPAELDSALSGADLPHESGAAPPRDSPARIVTRRPFRLHRVRKHRIGRAGPD